MHPRSQSGWRRTCSSRRLPWAAVADLVVADGRLVVEMVDGRSVRGPRLSDDVLAGARDDAMTLGLLNARG